MLTRIAPIRVVSLILLAACEALCQKSPSADLLPDAPSSIRSPKRETFSTFANETGSSWTFGAVGVSAGAMRGTELGAFPVGPHTTLIAHFQAAFVQKESSDFFSRYWHQPLIKQDPRFYASTSSSFMGRASYAASRIFLTRGDSGKNFGSTIGSDAGLNVFHEFGPGIRQIVKGHAPKFVFRIAERITHGQP